ncbi:jmjC domain-containing protein E-like [Physella acuta]|uniref:jmjC domain-containing protein E-like n=1 Tax=Physella acuta TaxID=109671 RepID=UPI0027DCEE80|nr:jmjC domain-containing protein E-like [Physella acuta]
MASKNIHHVYQSANNLLLIYAVLSATLQLAFLKTAPLFRPEDILEASQSHCLVLFPEEALADDLSKKLLHLLADVSFTNESSVLLGSIKFHYFVWPNGKALELPNEIEIENSILIIKRAQQDRTCLLVPNLKTVTPSPLYVTFRSSNGLVPVETVVTHINGYCHTFRTKTGVLNTAGIHREHILQNLYQTSKTEQPTSCMKPDNIKNEQDSTQYYCEQNTDFRSHQKYLKNKSRNTYKECERIPAPSSFQFFHEYVSLSKPVIITNATYHWKAFKKWTNDFLRQKYGDRQVHIKMTPDGIYEGVEPITLWEDYKSLTIPKSVQEKLLFSDLVVVRPASMEIKFSEFLDLMENISEGRVKDMSAYLEYSSISDYFPELAEDITEMDFFLNVLELKHLNIWLSDGNTLGKLHFDPFDNFLCQISGEKHLLLYEPHDNTKLYEAHIQEAKLSYDAATHTFHRKTLLESTSMVMSPVDPADPNFERFPKFAEVEPLSCKIQAGDVLFMPAFWWHEVQSKPNTTEHRNLAVNFWYEPFLTKEFPCQECKLDMNPKYYHLL